MRGSVKFDTGVSRNRHPEIGPDEGVQFVEVDHVLIAVQNDDKQAVPWRMPTKRR